MIEAVCVCDDETYGRGPGVSQATSASISQMPIKISEWRVIAVLALLVLAVLARLQFRQRPGAAADPVVPQPLAHALQIGLVRLDRFLLERIGLLFEQKVVLLEFVALEPA